MNSLGNPPAGALRTVVRANSQQYTVDNVTVSSNELGEVEENVDSFHEDLYLYAPDKVQIQQLAAQRISGDLEGLVIDDVNLDEGMRLTHGGQRYEISSVNGVPDDENPVVYHLVLEVMENE